MARGTKVPPQSPVPAQGGAAPAPTAADLQESPPSAFPVVGIGASAGGLAAFEAFFSALPAEGLPGMAFVLVQHLAPDHRSILPELVQRFTRLPVAEAADGIAVAINNVYVIPPRWDLEIHRGRLQLLEPTAARGHRLPVDGFFRSLAQDCQDAAIGIVLSGTGSDGAQGVQAIKRAGGLVLVQSTHTTEYDGMPRAALETGVVDQELPPNEMPQRLVDFVARTFLAGGGRGAAVPGDAALPAAGAAMARIFAQLRSRTGHDFSHYKISTVQRRVQRRMAVHQIDTAEGYAAYLQQSADEVQALFRDLLIGVTQFFRDADTFRVLQDTVIPALLARRTPGQPLRVWVPGCSTGEEAYSIAMLLLEALDEPATPQVLQIFATDIDARAVATARAGVYSAAIASDLPPERLARHFTPEPGGGAWRVRKQLRDLLVFSEHNLTRDPPFSRLDLISCRNLLIYLDGTLQRRILPLFHYALKPLGTLVLGTSESIGEFERLFEAVDRRAKVFRRLEDPRGRPRSLLNPLLPPADAGAAGSAASTPTTKTTVKPTLRELTERAVLRELPLAAALVNAQGDIFYLHGRTGMYLEPAPGEAGISNILAMAREGLRRELALALAQAAATRKGSAVRGLRVKTNGHHTSVNLSVSALDAAPEGGGPPMYLVMLEAAAADAATPGAPAAALAAPGPAAEPASDAGISAMAEALRISEERVQALHEELESSVEELKSSNEEMQSVNEELQSTNEELETSKEELQSVNEELSTVNAELENKVADLSRANDDMNNLLAGTGIATVFVDHGLRILRFTPGASEIINLIAADVGRPVGDLASNLEGYDSLVADTQAVLDSLAPKSCDVRTRSGRWYAMRILPYRTMQNVIEGAVITFVDISESVRTRQALRDVNLLLRLAVVVRDSFDAVTVHDLVGRTLAWNPAAAALYGWSEAEALALNLRDRVPSAQREQALAELRRLAAAHAPAPQEAVRLTKDGRQLEVWVKATELQDESGQVYALATTERARPA